MMGSGSTVLILGVQGTLGHRLALDLPGLGYEVMGTCRRSPVVLTGYGLQRYFQATDREALDNLLQDMMPDVVVNCIGWVRQRPVEGWLSEAILVNAVLPHWLSETCGALGVGLVHISTDCVGDDDWYGASKRLGENLEHGAVLRTSFIGHELERRRGLLEWILSQQGAVDGYYNVRWSGLTTNELARVIGVHVIPALDSLAGKVWNVCGRDISKWQLLRRINEVYGCGLEIRPAREPWADHRLDGTEFQAVTGYEPRPWQQLLTEMREAEAVKA